MEDENMSYAMKRLLALLLALTLCAALFPAALAEEAGSAAPAEEPELITLVEEPEEPDAIAPVGDEPEAAVAHGWCGDHLQWTLSADHVLTITGNGDMYDWSPELDPSSRPPWHDYDTSITSIQLPAGLTRIGSYAFSNFTHLTSITLPDGLKTIGVSGFSFCFALKSIKLPDSVTGIGDSTFSCCSSLTSVTLPYGLTEIPNACFRWCEDLQGLTIPASVGGIGRLAFESCSRLTAIEIPSGVGYIGEDAFRYCRSLTAVAVLSSSAHIDSADNTLGNPEITTLYGYKYSTTGSYADEYNYVFKPYEQFNPFLDVRPDKYYYKAVLWARDMGIVTGTDAAHFGVGSPCTRGQFVTFLYKAKDIPMG